MHEVRASRSEVDRRLAAAITMGAMAVIYFGLSTFYFWEDWFQYYRMGVPVHMDAAGLSVPVSDYIWTILSPWRLFLAVMSVSMLSLCGYKLAVGDPRSRALSLITLWGLLLPQAFWYMEFVVDWYAGQVTTVLAVGLLAVMVPTALLYDGRKTLGQWGLRRGSFRLVATTVALGWAAFYATELIDHSYQASSSTAYAAAFACISLCALGIVGIVRLRAWGLWVGVLGASMLAVVPFAIHDASYLHSGGYIDAFVHATTDSGWRQGLAALFPVALVWLCAAPFLHAFLRKFVRGIDTP